MFQKRPKNLQRKMGRFLIALCFILFPSKGYGFIESDNFYLKAEPELRLALRPNSHGWLSAPAIGLINVRSALEATENLYFSATALGRVPVVLEGPHVDAFLDLGESYLKFTHPDFVLYAGQLRIRWQTLKGAAINDRVNPVDYRRGYHFSANYGFIPQWGTSVNADILGFALQGSYLFWFRPHSSSMISIEQDGVRIGRYQGSLARSKEEFNERFQAGVERGNVRWFLDPILALRANKFLDDVSIAVNVLWSFDETPFVTANQLGLGRSLSFGAESSYSLGIAILKSEALVTPKIGDDMGKVTVLQSKDGILVSKPLTQLQVGAGVEAQYGDVVSGSLELIDTMWFSVPAAFHIYSIEAEEASSDLNRFVHRLALGFDFGGKFSEDQFQWTIRGEMGLNRWDILTSTDLQYTIAETGLTLGAFANLFFGVAHTPGWFRMPATEFGFKAVYNL